MLRRTGRGRWLDGRGCFGPAAPLSACGRERVMARIAVGGLHHETNTFATLKATYDEFLQGGGWPGIQRGQSFFTPFPGMHLPISGGIEVLAGGGDTIRRLALPTATPPAP